MLTAAVLGAAAALLLAAGAAKVAEPSRTAGALAALGLPSSTRLVRGGAAVEVLIGAGALVMGGTVAAAFVAVSYAVFAGFVVVALRSGTPVGSCGCFGRPDTPPRPDHVAIDALLAAGAVLAAVADAEPILAAPAAAWPLAAVLAAGAFVALTRPAPARA